MNENTCEMENKNLNERMVISMHYILMIFMLLFPVLAYSETLATCTPEIGHAYYTNMGIVDSVNSGWKVLPSNGTVSLTKLSEGNFDILFIDATNEIRSSTEEGATVKLLRSTDDEMAFIVSNSENMGITIYDFMHDKQGQYIITILTNKGGVNVPFYMSSVESGKCSFLKFNNP